MPAKVEAGSQCRSKPSWWQPYSSAANLVDQAERMVQSRKEEVYMRYLDSKGKEDGVLSYQGLWSRAGALAATIRRHGVKPGDRVLLCFAVGVEFIVVFWACLRAGVIAVPVYPPNPSKMAQALAKLELIRAAAGTTVCLMDKTVSRLRWLSMLTQSWPSMTYYNTETAVEENALPFVNLDIKLEDIAFLQYTSGSTGDPKGVVISHRNLWHNINEMIVPNNVRKNGLRLAATTFSRDVATAIPRYGPHLYVAVNFCHGLVRGGHVTAYFPWRSGAVAGGHVQVQRQLYNRPKLCLWAGRQAPCQPRSHKENAA